MSTATVSEESVLQAIIGHFLTAGARAEADARWLVGVLPNDLLEFFRAEFLSAIRQKAGSAGKARKIFLALGKTGRAIYGPEFARVKKALDAESRAVVSKAG